MNKNLAELNCTDVIVRCSEDTVQEITKEMITYYLWYDTKSLLQYHISTLAPIEKWNKSKPRRMCVEMSLLMGQ